MTADRKAQMVADIRGNRRCRNLRKSASSGSFSLEYATLVIIVAAAMIGMAIYVKRALSGRWRAVGDSFGQGRQYEVGK